MDITGTIKVKNNEQQVSEKFKKREFVIADNSTQYPQYIMFQITQDRCSLLDQYNVGDEVKVMFNIRGREWPDPKTNTVKYFNSLEAWKIEMVARGSTMPQPHQNASNAHSSVGLNGPSDDLPF